jgi:hypothetical protein
MLEPIRCGIVSLAKNASWKNEKPRFEPTNTESKDSQLMRFLLKINLKSSQNKFEHRAAGSYLTTSLTKITGAIFV